jgi:type I restriction enzyme, S subunit
MIDGLKPYPAYKEPKQPWLGKLPEHWTEKRAKYFYREVDERSTTGEEQLLSVSHVTGVTPRKTNVTMFMSETNVGHKITRPGDLVINTMWAWMAALGVARQVGIVSPSYGVYRPGPAKGLLPDYVDRLLRTQAYAAEYLCRSTGIRPSRLRLYPDDFLRIPMLCPPHNEQVAIVRFLDHADRLVRRYIRSKKNLITLLNEQKQAIIHQAITRGVDPNVKLKPSGVGWLGAVPEHWEVKRLKWVTRLQRGYDLPAERRIAGPFPVVSSGGIIDHHCEARSQGPGVVMGRYGSTDAVFFIETDFWPHNTALFVTDFQGNRPRWCYFMLRTISKADHAGKSAVPGVDRKDLFEIGVTKPPASEQDEIVAWIDSTSSDLDRAITAAKREIYLLQEYRTRLIADVVSGKLDVREAAARLPEDVEELQAIEDPEEFTELDEDMEGEESDEALGEADA